MHLKIELKKLGESFSSLESILTNRKFDMPKDDMNREIQAMMNKFVGVVFQESCYPFYAEPMGEYSMEGEYKNES